MDLNMNMTSCPPPFLAESTFPHVGGQIDGRYCTNLARDFSCCLPCPATQYLFDENFDHVIPIANYVSIASFACNSLLLITFLVLPEEQSHRHYLSIGLTVSLMMLALAFVIPLGTKPDLCFNEITPNSMYTDLSCAWTGALLEAGAMGIVVWILLRSVWTLLRAVFDFRQVDVFKWVSIALGVGLPAVLLAIAIPVTGVSYRLDNVCIPNNNNAIATWFGWLLIFATVASCLQIWTIVFCFWKFALSKLARGGGSNSSGHRHSSDIQSAGSDGAPRTPTTARRQKRVEWTRVQKLLKLQWRSMVLTCIVVNLTIFFGIAFVQTIGAQEERMHAPPTPLFREWVKCLVSPGGDRNKCIKYSSGLGLKKTRTIGTLILAAFIGPIVFLLMVRRSMFVGWYQLLSHPARMMRRGSDGSEDFISMGDATKHMSLTKHLGSEQRRQSAVIEPAAESIMAMGSGSHERMHSLEMGDEHAVGPKAEEEKMV